MTPEQAQQLAEVHSMLTRYLQSLELQQGEMRRLAHDHRSLTDRVTEVEGDNRLLALRVAECEQAIRRLEAKIGGVE